MDGQDYWKCFPKEGTPELREAKVRRVFKGPFRTLNLRGSTIQGSKICSMRHSGDIMKNGKESEVVDNTYIPLHSCENGLY